MTKKTIFFISVLIFPTLFYVYSKTQAIAGQCGWNPIGNLLRSTHAYSIDITDEILSNKPLVDSLLTQSRIEGNEIAFGDYSIGIEPCQRNVKVNWKNLSNQQIELKGLSSQSSITLRPGQSYTHVFDVPKSAPYTLNGLPKIIHVGSYAGRDMTSKKELESFCRQHAKGEAMVTLREKISPEELQTLFSKAHLEIERSDPYETFLVKVLPSFVSDHDLLELKSHPLFGNITFDCSFEEVSF